MSQNDKNDVKRICGVRTKRLLEIDYEIRTGKYPNCNTLAKQYGISSRTILRDIQLLIDEWLAPIEFDYAKTDIITQILIFISNHLELQRANFFPLQFLTIF